MLSKLNTKGRLWILLIAWILFTGIAVADTFDLSDDIALPTSFGQPAVASDSEEERKPTTFVLKIFLYRGESEPLALIRDSDASAMLSIPFPRSDTPLYQRHSVYRI
jgi:hypothetical protein